MTIYTSYYANVKNLPADVTPVAISRGVPKWFKGAADKRLAPTWAMMKSPRESYDRNFYNQLKKLDAKKLVQSLPKNPVLLCYEKPNDWCHRRMVAEWLEKELGIEVAEFGFERDESLLYKECDKKYAGKTRTEIFEKEMGSINKELEEELELEKKSKNEEPLAVQRRRESYNKDGENISLFDLI